MSSEFYNEDALHRYKSTAFAAELREYLDRTWPGCVGSSESTRWLLPYPDLGQQLLNGRSFTEIRTVYFRADITELQRNTLTWTCMYPQHMYRSAKRPGPTTWGWLPGKCIYKNQPAVAARYLFRWGSEGERQRALDGIADGKRDYRHDKWTVEMFEKGLVAAGMLGQEVYHCDLESGPWRT